MSMRVTNSMITVHSQSNINGVKTLVDKYNNQMTDQKKISKPSDDPVVAIRSLRLRSTLSDISQYYEKNIPDAQSWMEETETALKNMTELLKDVHTQCVNGANDSLTADDRSILLKNLASLKEQYYAEGNADYAGRTMFTGYKTNSTLTFTEKSDTAKYSINQSFDISSLTQKNYYTNGINVPTTSTDILAGIDVADEMTQVTNYRMRLAYSGVSDAAGTATLSMGGLVEGTDYNFSTMSYDDWEAGGFAIGDDDVMLIPETGELVFGSSISDKIKTEATTNADFRVDVTYQKKGFAEGDVRPEMYFDCTDISNAAEPIEYKKEIQDIEYSISKNQNMAVNIQASDDGILGTSVGREIDELLDAVNAAVSANDKVTKLEAMLKESQYADDDSQEALKNWLTAAKKEKTYADDNVQKLFSSAQTNIKEEQAEVNLATTDIGSRADRLKLTKTRVSNQQSTVKSLLSENEDRQMSDILIDYKSAYTAYESALSAASKANQMTLLDYL